MFRTVCNKYRRVLIFFIFSSLRVSMGFVQTDPIDSKVQTFFPDMRKCSHCDKHLLNQCHQYAYAFLNDTVFLTPLSVTRGHSITLSNEEQFHPWQMESLDITPPDQVSKTEATAREAWSPICGNQWWPPQSSIKGWTAVCGSSILCWMTGEAITCCRKIGLHAPPGRGFSFTDLVRSNIQWFHLSQIPYTGQCVQIPIYLKGRWCTYVLVGQAVYSSSVQQLCAWHEGVEVLSRWLLSAARVDQM